MNECFWVEKLRIYLWFVCVNLVYDQSHRLFEPLFRVKSPIFDHKFSITKLGARARAHAFPLLYHGSWGALMRERRKKINVLLSLVNEGESKNKFIFWFLIYLFLVWKCIISMYLILDWLKSHFSVLKKFI